MSIFFYNLQLTDCTLRKYKKCSVNYQKDNLNQISIMRKLGSLWTNSIENQLSLYNICLKIKKSLVKRISLYDDLQKCWT